MKTSHFVFMRFTISFSCTLFTSHFLCLYISLSLSLSLFLRSSPHWWAWMKSVISIGRIVFRRSYNYIPSISTKHVCMLAVTGLRNLSQNESRKNTSVQLLGGESGNLHVAYIYINLLKRRKKKKKKVQWLLFTLYIIFLLFFNLIFL